MNINDFELENTIMNVIKKEESRGTVISVIDGVALISGLKCVKSGETLEFIGANNEIFVKGMALNLIFKIIKNILVCKLFILNIRFRVKRSFFSSRSIDFSIF